MDQNITQLCDLDPMLDDIKIVARCIRVWKPHPIGNPKSPYSVECVLQDAQGNRVQATCKKDQMNKFQGLLTEGSCYRIGNFGVGLNGQKFKLINHKYKVNLFKNTSMTRLPIIDNNPHGFKFEPFPNFILKEFTADDIVDIIGTVVSISASIPYNNSGEDKIRRNLILEDVDGNKMDCCFFDDWAARFDNLYEHREKMGQVIMILQLAKVTYFNKKPSVRPTLYATKLYLNDDIPEIQAFRQRYNELDGHDPNNHSISEFTPTKKEMTPEEFFNNAQRKMIGSIRDSDKKYNCILYAKIHKIHREHGWAYLGCKKCGSKANEFDNDEGSSSSANNKSNQEQRWKCKKDGVITATVMKCKVMIRVIDETGSTSLLLFDDMIYKLCGVQVYPLMKKYGQEVDDYFPDELNGMVGKKLLFLFEYTDYHIRNNNHVYSVKCLSDDESMIATFKKDFIIEDAANEMETPDAPPVQLNKFRCADTIPFNIEVTPKSAITTKVINAETDKVTSGGGGDESGTSGSGKRTFIDLDDYPNEEDLAKKGKKYVEVKIEPKE